MSHIYVLVTGAAGAWQRDWQCVTVPDAKVFHAVNASNALTLKKGQRLPPRRYIANHSSLPVIGLKYYSGVRLLLAWCNLFVPLASDIFEFRWRKLSLDVQSILLAVRRMQDFRTFRRQNQERNNRRPGHQFFLQEDMTQS